MDPLAAARMGRYRFNPAARRSATLDAFSGASFYWDFLYVKDELRLNVTSAGRNFHKLLFRREWPC